MGNLEFPVLLYQSEDVDGSTGGERDPVDGRACASCLRRGYVSLSETMRRVCRRTNVDDNFSWHFNHFVDLGLAVVDISPRAWDGYSVLDTYSHLCDHVQYPFIPLHILLPRFFGESKGLWQCLMFIIF